MSDPVRIRLGRRRLDRGALVDEQDYEWLSQWSWHASGTGYGQRCVTHETRGKITIFLHRVVAERAYGDLGDLVVHHVNGDVLDNRRANLRPMTAGDHTRLHAPARTLAGRLARVRAGAPLSILERS